MNSIFMRVLLLAIIGGLIGYLTNVVAIKLIFRPLNPIKIPILNIEILGLIPKRKNEIAKNIGEIVQSEFIDMEEILSSVITEEDKDKIVKYTKHKLNAVIESKISYLPSTMRGMIQSFALSAIEEELRKSIDDLCEDLITNASERIDIQTIVENKVNDLDLITLENIILQVAKKELKHIELLGLILGFIIGIIQGLVTIII